MHRNKNISKTRRYHSEWEKVFANDTSYKGFILELHEESIQLNTTKPNNPITKWTVDLSKHSKEYVLMTNREVTRCSTSLIIRETQIITTVREHRTPLRSLSAMKQQTSVAEDVETREPSCPAGETVTGAATTKNSVEFPRKIKNSTTL